jgi:hypothetical protein
MIGEAALHGVFIPWLLILTLAAFGVTQLVRLFFRRLRLYRFVWHAGLFDVALFVIVLWLLTVGTADLGPGSTQI